MASAEHIKVANKTSRNSPAVGQKALTPKLARQWVDNNKSLTKDASILDFGAGKTAFHAQQFVADGYNCLAHEFGDNIDPRVHCELAMLNKYDVVYASNVLNVQADKEMLRETIAQVKSVMKKGGAFFANYPLSPRKSGLKPQEVINVLLEFFDDVMWMEGKKSAPVWIMQDYEETM